ncbi:MAG TPA: phage major tail protein, TP901-1 family [Hyphomonadaceae bacterium]|nr:phage major tail protein, TP901-1 family [Hyphomonadaceae bacterium]
MAGQRGRDVLVKVSNGDEPEEFRVVAGIRARRIALSTHPVEATTAESPRGWRELIAEAGTKQVEVTGSGAFKNALSDEWMRMAFFLGFAARYELVVADFGVLTGAFAIADLTYGGDQDGEATFSVRLVSAGEISFNAYD